MSEGGLILLLLIIAVLLTFIVRFKARIRQLEKEKHENRKDLAQYAHLEKLGRYELETKNGAITGLKEIIKYLEENQ